MKNKYFQHISLYLLNNYFMLHTIFDILVVHLGLHIYNTLHENRKKKRGEKKPNTIRDFNISSVFLVTSLNICLTVVFFLLQFFPFVSITLASTNQHQLPSSSLPVSLPSSDVPVIFD